MKQLAGIKMKLTRKQLVYLTGRSLSTIENWLYNRAKMPEHIACIKEEVERFIDEKRKEIRRYEDGLKLNNTKKLNRANAKRRS